MILVRDIRLPLSAGEPQAFEKALHLARIPRSKAAHLGVAKLSVDARHGQPRLVYTVAVTLKDEGEESAYAGASPCVAIRGKTDFSVQNGTQRLPHRPVVCGLGPAGLFAALLLARQGYKPIVLERGPALDERVKAVEHFSATGELDPNANIQFGEGGAGTFSDGKLNTGTKDERIFFVLQTLCEHGAPEDILFDAKPHVGTDKLPRVIENMRNTIIGCGGEVHFETRMDALIIENDEVKGIETDTGRTFLGPVILATGHSARDVYRWLAANGVEIEAKGIAVGVRLEHPASLIDRIQYHNRNGRGKYLPAAEYSFVTQVDGRGVYSFCMCPGGYVVNASSEEHRLAVNGMSYSDRAGKNANSAVIVTVTPEDFGSDDALAGIAFQRKLEENAWKAGQGKVPVQRFEDFRKNRISTEYGTVSPCIKGAYTLANVREIFPKELSLSLEDGILAMDHKIRGFAGEDVLLSGVESRTSSPVRIERNEQCVSEKISWIYPCGEGAGYAGGITSAAMDGIKVAEEIIRRYES